MLPAPSRKGDCKACREGKVECDRKRPRCTSCLAANKPCGGYDVGQIFINVTSTGPPPVWHRSQNAQKYLVLDLDSQLGGAEQAQLPFTSFPDVSGGAESSIMALAPSSMPNFLDADINNVSGMVDLFLDLYYRLFNPDKSSTDLLRPGRECGGWRSLLPQWIGQSDILDTAILALATCFIGTQYQNEDLLNKSQDWYLETMRMIQEVLPEPNSSQRKDLLATTLVMASLELFMGNGGGPSHFTHIDGATRLLQAGFQSSSFDETHIYVLNQGLFEAISSRRRYTFSSPSYRSSIRQLYSTQRARGEELFLQWCEIALPLPNILHSVDTIAATSRSDSPTHTSAILAILDEITALEQSLGPWYEALKARFVGPWTSSASTASPANVPFPLQFNCIEACTVYNLYWASQLLILDARCVLHSDLPVHQAPEIASLNLRARLSEYASLICRSVQFCTSKTSFAAAECDEDRMKWCVNSFTCIAREHKIGFSIERLDLDKGKVHL